MDSKQQIDWQRIGHMSIAVPLLGMAALLRGTLLSRLPPGLARDEALNADIAELILKGQHAIVFREGFGHEPLFHYMGSLFLLLVGDNALAIRLPSFFCGLLLIALVTSSAEFPRRTTLVAAIATTFSWWAITFSRIGIRPISLPLFLILTLHLWRKRPLFAGAALGLSVYTYTAARFAPLWPLADIAITLLFVRDSAEKKTRLKQSSTLLVSSLIIATPLYYTLQTTPDLNERINQLAGPIDALRAGDPSWFLSNLAKSISSFGFVNLASSAYALDTAPLIPWITGIFLVFGIIFSLKKFQHHHTSALLLTGWFLFILPGAASAESPTDIRMIGTLPMTMLLIGIGVTQSANLFKSSPTRPIAPFLLTVLVALAFLQQTVSDGLITWTSLPETRQKYQSIWLDISDDIRQHGNTSLVVADSWYEPVKADSLRRDYGHPLDARWVFNGSALVLPATESWLYIPEFTPLDPVLHSRVLNDSPPDLRSNNKPAFARYLLPSAPAVEPIAIFGGQIGLLSIEHLEDDRILSQWHVKTTPTWDSTIFIHLIAEDGALIAQSDGLFVAPDSLQPGDTFWQVQGFDSAEIPTTIPTLHVGIYQRSSGQRLPLPDGSDHYAIPFPEVPRAD